MAFDQVSGVPAGVIRVISDGFVDPVRAFSKSACTISREHVSSGMGTKSLGMIGCIFAENWPLEGGIESRFWGTGWGAKGDFIHYSYLYPYIFESSTHIFFEVDFRPLRVHFRREPATIFRKYMPSGIGTKSLEMIGCIFAENGPLENGIGSSFWGTGWGANGDVR